MGKGFILPPIDASFASKDILTRDMQLLGVNAESVIQALLSDIFTDTSESISAIYQIAYDNFYTHPLQSVPWTEDGVGEYVAEMYRRIWECMNRDLDDLISYGRPQYIDITSLPDLSIFVEFKYNA